MNNSQIIGGLFLLGIGLLAFSNISGYTSKRVVSVDDYLYYYYQNRAQFLVRTQASTLSYTLEYLPIDYQIARELKRKSTASIDSLYEAYNGYHYFNFSIQTLSGKSIKNHLSSKRTLPKYSQTKEQEIQEIFRQLHFYAKEDFSLSNMENTKICKAFHLEEEPLEGMGLRYHLVIEDPLYDSGDSLKDQLLTFSYQNKYLAPKGLQIKLSQELLQPSKQLKRK